MSETLPASLVIHRKDINCIILLIHFANSLSSRFTRAPVPLFVITNFIIFHSFVRAVSSVLITLLFHKFFKPHTAASLHAELTSPTRLVFLNFLCSYTLSVFGLIFANFWRVFDCTLKLLRTYIVHTSYIHRTYIVHTSYIHRIAFCVFRLQCYGAMTEISRVVY